MKPFINVILLFVFSGIFNSCKKDDDSNGPDASSGTGSTITASFSGRVNDTQGVFISGATVTIGNKSAVTDINGVYNIANAEVNKERVVITAEKSNYWTQQKGIIAQESVLNFEDITLFYDDKNHSFNSITGGSVNLNNGGTIVFSANSMVTSSGSPYNGTVRVTAHQFNPSDPLFHSKVPGGDLLAQDAAGNTTLLQSYGMTGAKLYDIAGNPLQLKVGMNATIKFPISAVQQSVAPATIPIWHYDEALGMWKEDGVATRIGNFYEGSVNHFSWWNCDIPCEYANFRINITACNGLPMGNEIVSIQWGAQITQGITNSSGSEMGIVPANVQLTVICRQPGMQNPDTTFSIGPFTQGSNNVLNINLPNLRCEYGILSFTDCNGNGVNASSVIYHNNQLHGYYSAQGGNIFVYDMVQGMYVIQTTNGFMYSIDTVYVTPGTTFPLSIPIDICDSIQGSTNNLMMTISNVQGVVNINRSVISARLFSINNVHRMELVLFDPIASDSSSLLIYTPIYSPGTYTWDTTSCYINGSVIDTWNYYFLNSQVGTTVLNATPPLFGVYSGSFSGTMLVSLSGIPVPSTVTGSFNATRTH